MSGEPRLQPETPHSQTTPPRYPNMEVKSLIETGHSIGRTPSPLSVNSCTYCPSALRPMPPGYNGPTARDCDQIFHQHCRRCALSPIQYQDVCPAWCHLRLRHLVKCVPVHLHRKFTFVLKLCSKSGEGTSIPECSLCRFFSKMITRTVPGDKLSKRRQTAYGVHLGIDLGSAPACASGIDALVDIQFQERIGDWKGWIDSKAVGTIRIDDVDNVLYERIGSRVYWPRLRNIVSKCCRDHLRCGPADKRNLPQGFRVIDITKRCIVECTVPFVALSYVWGRDLSQSSLVEARRATLKAMMREGGLPASKMPRTVEDAMKICTQLGFRYLWVDRLCILQDDLNDKVKQILRMGDIYSSAMLVIVAEHGNNMDCGIPGVSKLRPVSQYHEDFAGLRITNIVEESVPDPHVDVWNTRGWTYQEAVLARRLLRFTNTQAYFSCQMSTHREDAFYDQNDVKNNNFLLRKEGETPFQAFARHLYNYTPRLLTYQSDTYNAFYGVTTSLYRSYDLEPVLYGLPRLDFNRALLWSTRHTKDFPNHDRKLSFKTPVDASMTLPSWSWASAMVAGDEPYYWSHPLQFGFAGPLSIWYQITSTSDLNRRAHAYPTRASNSMESRFRDINLYRETVVEFIPHFEDPIPTGSYRVTEIGENWALCMALACGQGVVPTVNVPWSREKDGFVTVPWSKEQDGFTTIRDKFTARWSDYYTFCKEALHAPALRPLSGYLDVHGDDFKPGTIVTWTQTASLGLCAYSDVELGITNDDGDLIGYLHRSRESPEPTELKSPHYDRGTKYEFIAVSLSYTSREEYFMSTYSITYVDLDGKEEDMKPVVHVLMIGRRGDYAYRKTHGWVYMKPWAKAARRWETVVLE